MGVMLRISPTRMLEYLLKFPPLDKIASPMAMLQEEKTEITVSVEAATRLLIWFSSKANTMANTAMEKSVFPTPSTTPTAIPVKAECPSASEKKAIFRLTTIVPISPNKGVIISTARNANLIKSYCSHANIPICLPSFTLPEIPLQIPHFGTLPLHCLAAKWFYPAGLLCPHTVLHSPNHGKSG